MVFNYDFTPSASLSDWLVMGLNRVHSADSNPQPLEYRPGCYGTDLYKFWAASELSLLIMTLEEEEDQSV